MVSIEPKTSAAPRGEHQARPSLAWTVLLTSATLLAFAGNSILCRLALREGAIGPASFTALRLAGGALVLCPLLWRGRCQATPWTPRAALALAAYAIGFSLAYVNLPAGTGALLLFGAVQLTMLGLARLAGERTTLRQVLGILIAAAGLVWLAAPGATAPDPRAALLMLIAGAAWGIYSVLGRGTQDPALATARNFLLAVPLGLLLYALAGRSEPIAARGVVLALVSGSVTSGLGYVLWYVALRGHTTTSAAVVQLAVPALAAFGGVLLLGEAVSVRLVGASALTLGGVGLAIRARTRIAR